MKYFVIVLLALTFSCSSEETELIDSRIENDQFIGKWIFGKTVLINDDGREETPPTQCDLMTSYNFLSDGTYEIVSYVPINDICTLEDTVADYRLWENVNGNQYRLINKNQGEEEETTIINIDFLNPDTMKWVDNGTFYNDNNEVFDTREFYLNKD